MTRQLADQTVLVTGGGRGIGRAIVLRLAEAGARVIVNYCRSETEAHETCAHVRALGGVAKAVAADVGNPRSVRSMCEQIRVWGWRLDAVVHNAAVGRFQPLLEARPADWDIALRTNAHALLLVTREVLDLLEPGARVVAVSSLGSHRYVPFYGAIGPSKAALESVVRTLAVELAPRGIRVNAASGGLIDGPTLRCFPAHELVREAALQRTPAGRLGTCEELADVVLFLCSEQSRWMYGQVVIADGGFGLS
jgi:enoyl-[acyl-carrier protein] reductase III